VKAPILTSVARTIASTLMPSRINVKTDSLAKAIAKKIGNNSISDKSVKKLELISNFHDFPASYLHGSVDHCTHETPVRAMKQQLQEVSLSPRRAKVKNHDVPAKITRIFNQVALRVSYAEDLWTESYWKNRDGGTSEMQSKADTAVLRLGYKPEWKDYRLALQVTNLTQDMEVSTSTIDRMHAAFHGLYRIPQQDDAGTTRLTFSDFPDPSNLPDFVDLSVAAEDLRDAHDQLSSLHSARIRHKVERTLQDLGSILQSSFEALMSRHEELVATPNGATNELNAIRKWLGAPELSNDTLIDLDENADTSPSPSDEADADASPEGRMDHSPLAKAHLLNIFASAMDCFRHADEGFVDYELRSADAMAAMGSAFVESLGFNLPGHQQQHVLADFPVALEMQTFRSIPERLSDLDLMRRQLRDLDSVDGRQRLSDRISSFRAVLECAEDFWTDRLEDLEKRKAAGESVKDEIHIARKWLGDHDPLVVSVLAPTPDPVRTNSGRRGMSQASHLFDPSEAKQTRQKHHIPATKTDARAHARLQAMR